MEQNKQSQDGSGTNKVTYSPDQQKKSDPSSATPQKGDDRKEKEEEERKTDNDNTKSGENAGKPGKP